MTSLLFAVSISWAQAAAEDDEYEEEVAEEVEESVESSGEGSAPADEAVEEVAAEDISEEYDSDEDGTADENAVVADATATDEVVEESDGSEESIEDSEEISEDEEEEVVKKSKKKKKKSKKKKSKKKKKKHDGDVGPKYGAHMVLTPDFSDWNNYGIGANLGFGFAYYFNSQMGVRTGLDLGISYKLSKTTSQQCLNIYNCTVLETNSSDLVFSIQLPIYFRYVINEMFWAEAGFVVGGNFYSYIHSSNSLYGDSYSYGQLGSGNFDAEAGLNNTTIGGGVSLGDFDVGLQLGIGDWGAIASSFNVGITLGYWL